MIVSPSTALSPSKEELAAAEPKAFATGHSPVTVHDDGMRPIRASAALVSGVLRAEAVIVCMLDLTLAGGLRKARRFQGLSPNRPSLEACG